MRILISLLLIVSIGACKNINSQHVWTQLPEVTSLDSLKQTDFVPTLENPISGNKNIIYAPAFLYAWNKLSETLGDKIVIADSNSNDFKLVTRSTSYQNSLTDSEYTTDIIVGSGDIFIRAFFNKTLPFETKLEKAEAPMFFDKIKVGAFGMYHYDYTIVGNSRILYYKDDNNFILKLLPKDKANEIILVKGLEDIPSLAEAINRTNILIQLGEKEKNDHASTWKYQITPDDIFSIPEISFNIETHYKEIEGETLSTTRPKGMTAILAYQRTGFILNENGAVVESEASAAAADSSDAQPIITHPKKMVFDSQFYIIIKHADQTNPYFVMKVNNTKLMNNEK